MRLVFSYLLLLASSVCARPQEDPPQIHWQRTFEDATELARTAHRPLLLCVNMDAESASEQTARGRYRDPSFVEATRRFVCAIASPVRHNPRDYDDEGRRIPCARFGGITCGEHLAMEPAIFAKVGGERIAPRHTLYAIDGQQVFDLFLLFDLQEIDRRVKAAAEAVGAPWEKPLPTTISGLIADRRNAARRELERRFLEADTEERLSILDLVARGGPEKHPDLLRLALHGSVDSVAERCRAHLDAGDLRAALEPALRDSMLWAEDERLATLGERWTWFLGSDPAARRLALSYALDGPAELRAAMRERLLAVVDEEEGAALEALWSEGATDFASVLRDAPPFVSEPRTPWTNVPDQAAGELLLERLDEILASRRGDALVQFEMGRASLLLGERFVLDGGDPSFFLADAMRFLEDALEGLAADDSRRGTAHLLRARAAFLRNDFSEARRAALAGLREEGAEKATRIEAARLALDSSLRDLSERFSELSLLDFGRTIQEGFELAARIVPTGDLAEGDWQRFANLYAFCGRTGDRALALRTGVERAPESVALHVSWRDLVWGAGRLSRLLERYEALDAASESATTAWFAGSAWVGLAEQSRRVLQFGEAIAAYERARESFERSTARNAQYADTSRQWGALIDLGEAFCRMELRELERSAELLASAFAKGVALDHVDGVEREPQDLIDKLVEHGLPGTRLFEILASELEGRGDVLERVPWATFREAYRARGRSEPAVADRFFRETLDVYEELDATVEGAGNDPDRARALLENARIEASEGEGEKAFRLMERAAEVLERDWREAAAAAIAARWLEELGHSTTFVRTGR